MKMQTQDIPLIIAGVKTYLLNFQRSVCDVLTKKDQEAKVDTDIWCDEKLGYGTSKILKEGSILEKAGVNFSHVFGKKLPASAVEKRPDLTGGFQAIGVSIIVHPFNPYIPTSHANLRLFTALNNQGEEVWWFGGGFDLTPHYGFEEDCIYWHKMAKKACEPFGKNVYPHYKRWCDDYFYIKHRKIQRGIGGIFFDNLNDWEFETCFDFIKSVGEHYIEAYAELIDRRKYTSYGEKERQFLAYRRGRYVEFNLIYDRGTQFGLQTGGRVESILASLPPEVSWKHDWGLECNIDEELLTQKFLIKKDWI